MTSSIYNIECPSFYGEHLAQLLVPIQAAIKTSPAGVAGNGTYPHEGNLLLQVLVEPLQA